MCLFYMIQLREEGTGSLMESKCGNTPTSMGRQTTGTTVQAMQETKQ